LLLLLLLLLKWLLLRLKNVICIILLHHISINLIRFKIILHLLSDLILYIGLNNIGCKKWFTIIKLHLLGPLKELCKYIFLILNILLDLVILLVLLNVLILKNLIWVRIAIIIQINRLL
jgi:hypothetical protein